MFRQIAAFWRDDSPMKEVVGLLGDMVSAAEYVFHHAWEVCTGRAGVDATRGLVKGRDKESNKLEREVRRRVLEHLSINPGQDASGCMAVMLMAKDLERLGDCGKYAFELAAKHAGPIAEMKLFGRMDALGLRIRRLLPRLREAIIESSEPMAREVLDEYLLLKKELRDLESALFTTEMSTDEAVTATLMTRTLIRINAHIGNVASGVIFPLENIDFVSRGLRKEASGN